MPENTITIDGRKSTFNPGETILEVARQNGIFIPTLCHLKGTKPTGACRVCVVEIEGGRGLSPACSMPAGDKMVVHTSSPVVLEARRTILALLLNSGNHNCAISTKDSEDWTEFEQHVENYDQSADLCAAHSACKLQAYAYRYQVDTRGLIRRETEYPIEMASPLIMRDFSRCILCGRCVAACNETQVNRAISHGFRGAKAKIVAMGNDSLERSECVFCGECLQACPVGALVEKKTRYQIRPWEASHVRTTCNYCGVGCQLDLHIKDDTIMKVTGVEDALPNLGRLCVKGRFGYDFLKSPERLTKPMIRKDGELKEASWNEALDLVATKIKKIKGKEGPEAIAGICSAKSTNEALYLMQKLFRGSIGTNNLGSPYAANGLNNPIGDLEEAKNIFLIGCDVTEENPVAGTFIKRASNNGCRLIVVDSHPTKIGEFATIHLLVKQGSESVLVNGIIQELLTRGREGSEEIRDTAANFPLNTVAETTGIPAEDVKAAADIIDTDESAMLVYGPRVAPFARTFLYLQEVLGNLGRACGGVNYLGDLNNSQGACDMGILPDYLPGYARVDDNEARKTFEKAWGCSLNSEPGLALADIMKNMTGKSDSPEKKIRLLYCVGENLAITSPAIPDITKALESTDFIIVQDILANETLKYADVVLPAAAWSEDEGTYTNCERRVSRMRSAVTAPGEAKPETWIFTQLANRLDQKWPDASSREIWENEIAKLVPQFQGITYDRLQEGGLQWPVPDPGSSGTANLNGNRPPLCMASFVPFNYHHRAMLEQCEGLLESLTELAGGTRKPPTDLQEVTDKFMELLEEEEKTDAKAQIDEILATYRPKMGGLIPVLQQVQEILGFLPIPTQNYIALGLGIPPSDVFGVVTFYSFFTMVPRGRHIIRICLGTACFVKGSAKLLDTVSRHLDVDVGETTDDREYSLDVVRCLGACGLAPVMVVDDVTHGQVDPTEVVNIVESVRGSTEEG
ncbi:MAG: molybdopterin-dependent oxidoreductase [Deltaproteobacteria bacterium]|nr:molybdopterin-dependent oxidoreductase [Deltaproteobacteria bacterium]MBW2345176.1 molybdopterin-dependent oxidoreductase [Deltaproteobacteria bacterium]